MATRDSTGVCIGLGLAPIASRIDILRAISEAGQIADFELRRVGEQLSTTRAALYRARRAGQIVGTTAFTS